MYPLTPRRLLALKREDICGDLKGEEITVEWWKGVYCETVEGRREEMKATKNIQSGVGNDNPHAFLTNPQYDRHYDNLYPSIRPLQLPNVMVPWRVQ